MNTNIFRKSSIEQMSSPEQLNDYIRVIRAKTWCVLTALLVIAVGAIYWAFTATIPHSISINAVAATENNNSVVYAYLPLKTSKHFSKDMQVQVSPDYAAREEAGYIYGRITDLGDKLISRNDLKARYGDLSYVAGILPKEEEGNFVQVKIELEKQDGGLRWSNAKSSDITLEDGAFCTGVVVVEQRRPYEFFTGGIKR